MSTHSIRTLGIVALVAIPFAVAAGIAWQGRPMPATWQPTSGTVAVKEYKAEWAGDVLGQVCSGVGPFSSVTSHAPVVVLGLNGETVGSGSLGVGALVAPAPTASTTSGVPAASSVTTPVDAECQFAIEVRPLPRADGYRLMIGDLGPVELTYDQLSKTGWRLDI